MAKIRVGLDIDGVLADFNTPFIDLIYKHSGVRLPAPSDTYPDKWNYERDAGMEKSRSNAMWEEIKASNDFWYKVPSYPHTHRVLAELDEMQEMNDIEVYFITSRMGRRVKKQTENWLYKHGFWTSTVLISHHKGQAAATLNLSHYIDDKNENCTDVQRDSPGTKGYMLARPYNSEQTGIPRITNINEFIEKVWEDYEHIERSSRQRN